MHVRGGSMGKSFLLQLDSSVFLVAREMIELGFSVLELLES